MPNSDAPKKQSLRQHWRDKLRLIAGLLAIWFVVSDYARNLSFGFFGWPFSFWMAAQGPLVVCCLIVWVYAWSMSQLDLRDGIEEREE